MSETVIPTAIRLGDNKPVGVAAHRRSAVHMSTTQNVFGPGTIARLPIETGGHGIWADVSRTGRLEFDFQVINNNPYADFMSLGRVGLGCVIEEIQLEVNGVPIEINRQYAATAELQMIRRGQNPDPFYHTFANKYQEPNVGELHCNLVKPCMVDVQGRSWDYQGGSLDVFVPPPISFNYEFAGDTGALQSINYTATRPGNDVRMYLQSNRVGELDAADVSAALTDLTVAPYNGLGGVSWFMGTTVVPNNAPNLLGPLRLGRDWDALKQDVKANLTSRNNLKDCSMYYAQAKYLPIMCKPTNTNPLSYVGGVEDGGNYSPLTWDNCGVYYHVSLPLEMGVMGTLNPSALPSFMFGAGRTSLVIKFASAAHVFDLTMDPNRVVPGTMRGFVPFQGRRAGSRTPGDALQATLSVNVHPTLGLAMASAAGYNEGATPAHNSIFPSIAAATGTITSLLNGHANDAAVQTSRIATGSYAPVPQYALALGGTRYPASMQEAWHVNTAYARESQACFGTWRKWGIPQSRRASLAALPLSVPQTHYGETTYKISGLMYRVEEILMNDQVTASVLSAAMGGKAVLGTTVLKEMKQQTFVNASQKILAPFTGANVADVCFAFRHPKQLDYTDAFSYPTFSFVNPFANVQKAVTSTYEENGTTYQYKVGAGSAADYTIQHAFDTTLNSNIELYAQLASEQIPRNHIRSVDHLVEFVTAGDQIFSGASDVGGYRRLGGIPNQHDCNYSLTSAPLYGDRRQVSCLEDGFFAAHLPMDCLDDQTITGNPHLIAGMAAAYLPTTDGPLIKERGPYFLKHTEPLQGTFHLSFNLETFQGLGDKLRSGTTVVNNQFFLLFENAFLCAQTTLEMLVVARCYAKIVFERGGGVQVIS